MAALPGVRQSPPWALPGFAEKWSRGKGFSRAGPEPRRPSRAIGWSRELASAIVRMPDVRKRLEALGVIADGRRNEEFGKVVQSDIAYWLSCTMPKSSNGTSRCAAARLAGAERTLGAFVVSSRCCRGRHSLFTFVLARFRRVERNNREPPR